MAQKTIWSFFSKSPKVAESPPKPRTTDESDKETSEDSPTKAPTKSKRRRISSSDEDEPKDKSPEIDNKKKRTSTNSPTTFTSGSKAKGSETPPPESDEPSSPLRKPSEKSPTTNDDSAKKNGTKTPPKKAAVTNSPPSTNKETTKKAKPKKSEKPLKTTKKTPAAKKSGNESTKKSASKVKPIKLKMENDEEVKKEDTPSPMSDGNDASINPSPVKTEAEPSKPATKPNAMNAFFTRKSDTKTNDSQAGVSYNPGRKNYHPIDDAFWKHGESVPYLALTQTFAMIEDISGRLRTIEVVANFLRSVIVLSPNDLLPCVYLCMNQLAPAYEGLELGVAETSLMKVIAQTTGRSLAQIKTDSKETGDLGIVAERSKSNQRMMFVPAPLTVAGVFAKLKEIARMSGHASMGKKVDKMQAIFVSCRHSEARFFIRSLLGKLRIGLAEQSLLHAIAQACALTPPNQKEYPPKVLQAVRGESSVKQRVEEVALIIKTTYCQCPNYNRIVSVLLDGGVDCLLAECKMSPGTPLKPMLAHPTKGVGEVLERFDGLKFTCEFKYDGERAQIHIHEDGTVNIYSRNQENNTSKYPDIIARIDMAKDDSVRSCILDCEAVAWDLDKKQILPFQVLSTRKRKDATEDDIKVQVCVFMFDLLFLNDEPLVTRPFVERRNLLRKHFKETEGIWQYATALDTSDTDELQAFLDESVKGNCEGLMVKTLERDATYEIAKRSRNWLKLKKDYLSGVGDSLDLVVIGGFKGKGKRTGTYGGFLLACYDSEDERYQSICKIGTGFSDDDLQTHTEFFKPHVIPNSKSYYLYDSSHEPDDWFEPVQIWEVLCADLSLSPVHKAGIGIVDPEKGISLRFPRFIRIRDDKSVEDATSAQQVADMYSNQDQIKNQDKSSKSLGEEDFY